MTPQYPHPLIAREGWPYIGGLLAVSIVVNLVGGFEWAWPFWLATLFVLQFFRDPARDVPAAPDAVLAPADGRVIVVAQARDPYAERDALKVSIFMNVFNVHINRTPVTGAVERIVYIPGKFINAELDKASEDNERQHILVERSDGTRIGFTQIAGLVARRIVPFVKPGDILAAGQRVGLIRFGSRVDVYLPAGTEPKVLLGQKVIAGETVLAEIGEQPLIEGVNQ